MWLVGHRTDETNGLFAILPLELLRPLAELPDALKEPSPLDPRQKRMFDEWQSRADRILVKLGEMLSAENDFDPEQVRRPAANIWHRRVAAVRSNDAPGAAPREPSYLQNRCRRISSRRSAQNMTL